LLGSVASAIGLSLLLMYKVLILHEHPKEYVSMIKAVCHRQFVVAYDLKLVGLVPLLIDTGC
jgi:hypothetical protein